MTNRNSTIDITKGIGIILVVLGHNPILLQEIKGLFEIIYSFHVLLFFFLSGIFIRKSSQFNRFMLSRADSLLKPYFAVFIILGVIKLLAGITTTGTAHPALFKYFVGMLYGTGGTIAWDAPAWMPLWFLPHLFLSSAFVLLILKSLRSSQVYVVYLVAAILLVLGVYFLGYFWRQEPMRLGSIEIPSLLGLPWSLDLLPITSTFVIAGSLLSRHVQLMRFNSARLLVSISIFSGLLFFYDTMNLNIRVYGNLFISTLQAVLGIYICLSLSCLLQRHAIFRRPLAYIGTGTLFILIFHSFFQYEALLLLSKLANSPFLVGIGSLIVGIALPLALWEIIKRNSALAGMILPKKYNTSPVSTASRLRTTGQNPTEERSRKSPIQSPPGSV